jgi:hypothetical protein
VVMAPAVTSTLDTWQAGGESGGTSVPVLLCVGLRGVQVVQVCWQGHGEWMAMMVEEWKRGRGQADAAG